MWVALDVSVAVGGHVMGGVQEPDLVAAAARTAALWTQLPWTYVHCCPELARSDAVRLVDVNGPCAL